MASELGTSANDVLSRLKKIEGQARGIQRMITDGRDCEDVIIQMTALRAAVAKACVAMVSSRLQECLLKQGDEDSLRDSLLQASKMLMKISS